MPKTQSIPAIHFSSLPALGAPLEGGIFVGVITQPGGAHFAVSLLHDRTTDVTWQAAKDWAIGLNAQLPARPMAALIFANTQDRPQTGWHWTCEEVEGLASYAWLCGFSHGYQYGGRKSYEGAAVAVRLIYITA